MALRPVPFKFVEITDDILEKAAKITDENAFISIYRAGSGYRYSVRFRFSEATQRDFLLKHFGGYPADQHFESGACLYWLNLLQARGVRFLKTIRPFVKVKADQIDLVMDFLKFVKMNGKKRLTEQVLLARQEKLDALMVLTKRNLKADPAKS